MLGLWMRLALTARRKDLLDKLAGQLNTEVAVAAGDITDESLPQKLMTNCWNSNWTNCVRKKLN